jgi:hypothetical protein
MTLYDILTAAVPALGVVLLGLVIYDTIADRIFHRRLHKMLKQQALTNGAFNSEELMLEADKLMHDEEESDNARDFARRVYIIGRTAKSAIEGEE